MAALLNQTAQAIPKAIVYRIAAVIAVICAAVTLTISTLLRPNFGVIVGYAVVPLLAAFAVWAIAFTSRLKVVGFLTREADHFIASKLKPWIRF